MAFFSGNLHRPLSAMAAAAAAASFSTDRFHHIPSRPSETPVKPDETPEPSSIARISVSNLSLIKNIIACPPIPDPNKPDQLTTRFAAPTALLAPYQYAKLANPYVVRDPAPLAMRSTPAPDVLYRWLLPDPNTNSGSDKCTPGRSKTVVVLLGWLGARQRHLNRYAEWYTSRGFHVVTFTFPLSDIVSYKVEDSIEQLADHLRGWVDEESGKKMVFHTFSNTGWLTYGALLDQFRSQDPSVLGKIRGCIVDSAPVANADPQVWASGFSAAFLKKQSVATRGSVISNNLGIDSLVANNSVGEAKPAVLEAALLVVLEKLFGVVLNVPSINRRLHDVVSVLSSEQPKCPQLYIYSSADRVIPAKSVESFIERQRQAGHEVRACNFLNSPHVDHFRNHPQLYTCQLTNFLEDCVLTCRND